MKCFYCNAEVRWNNDYDTEDTYPDSEHNIVSMYNCDECDTWYEVPLELSKVSQHRLGQLHFSK